MPGLDLVIQKRLAITSNDRLHDRMLGQVRLHQSLADKVRAAGAASDLVQQLECALASPRISAVSKAEIAIDNADKGEVWKVVTLGDDLRANDDVDLAALRFCGSSRAFQRGRE